MCNQVKNSWQNLSVALVLFLVFSGCGGGSTTSAQVTASSIPGIWKLMSLASNGGTPTDMSAANMTVGIDASTLTYTLPAAVTIAGTTYAACTETDTWILNGNQLSTTVTASPVTGSFCDPVGTVNTNTVLVSGSTMTITTSTGDVYTYSLQPITTIASMPYNGSVTGANDSYYVYTTVGDVNEISAAALTSDINVKVYEDATFTNLLAWGCSLNSGTTADSCTSISTTSVPAGTVLYIKVKNVAGTSGTFTLSVSANASGACMSYACGYYGCAPSGCSMTTAAECTGGSDFFPTSSCAYLGF